MSEVANMNKLESNLYHSFKKQTRMAQLIISSDVYKHNNNDIMVLVDFYNLKSIIGEEQRIISYIKENCNVTISNGLDTDLIVYKYCNEHQLKYRINARDYEYYKTVNGTRIYRKQEFAKIEVIIDMKVSV